MGTSKLISLMSDIVLNTESACSNAEATSGSNSSQKNLRGTAIRSLCAGGSSIRTGEADPHPCTTSVSLAIAWKMIAASSTVRAIVPTWSSDCDNGITPRVLTVLKVGFRPTTLHSDAGSGMETEVSVTIE